MAIHDYTAAGMGGLPTPHLEAGRVRKATAADLASLAGAMAAAFYEDPVAAWLFRDDSRRRQQLELGFALFIRRLYLPAGECYTTANIVGGALWAPPGRWRVGVADQLRLLPVLARLCGRELPRFLRYSTLLESKHRPQDHYFLPFAGVKPECQGRGIGSALISPVLVRCDREGVPAYLEATAPRNRALYERHGFAVVEELELEDGPTMWLMWREPARP